LSRSWLGAALPLFTQSALPNRRDGGQTGRSLRARRGARNEAPLGIYHEDRDGFVTRVTFLSEETKPAEKEAREALARLLVGKAAIIPRDIMWKLAALFDSNVGQSPETPRKLAFEILHHQHAISVRNAQIAMWICNNIMDGVKTYEEAIEAAAERFGISERQAKRIYGTIPKKHRPRREKRRQKLRLV
jgi:hypothetical protein